MSQISGVAHSDKPMAGWLEGEPMYTDKQLVIRHTIPANGLTFAGALDIHNADSVASTLSAQMERHGDLHIDLSHVEFCDVSGIRALVSAVQGSDGHRRLVVHGLPPLLQRVMTLVGWGQLPGLELCECGTEKL